MNKISINIKEAMSFLVQEESKQTMSNNIKKYNNHLAKTTVKLNIREYFTNIHQKFYEDIDISFMDYFLSICEHEDIFCVHHDKLKEYGIITEGRSDKIKRCLDQFEMILNKDYVCLTLSDIKSYNSRFKCPTLGHLK